MSINHRFKVLHRENEALRKEVALLRHALLMLASEHPSAHTAIIAGIICEDGRYEVTIAQEKP